MCNFPYCRYRRCENPPTSISKPTSTSEPGMCVCVYRRLAKEKERPLPTFASTSCMGSNFSKMVSRMEAAQMVSGV